MTPTVCPKGAKAIIKTREPTGRWMAFGSKTITCPCNCLRVTEGYHKGGQAWKIAESKAIERWNDEVKTMMEPNNAK